MSRVCDMPQGSAPPRRAGGSPGGLFVRPWANSVLHTTAGCHGGTPPVWKFIVGRSTGMSSLVHICQIGCSDRLGKKYPSLHPDDSIDVMIIYRLVRISGRRITHRPLPYAGGGLLPCSGTGIGSTDRGLVECGGRAGGGGAPGGEIDPGSRVTRRGSVEEARRCSIHA